MAYGPEVLADSPVAYWRLGEVTPGTGTAVCAPTTHNGTYVASPTGVPGLLLGDSDGAVNFDGSSQYVTVADHANLKPSAALSVEVWAKPDVVTGGRQLIRKDTDYRLYQSGDAYGFQVNIAGTPRTVQAAAGTAAVGVPAHLVGTYSDALDTLAFYINGVLAVSATWSGTITTSTAALGIAALTVGPAQFFDGTLDEVAFYGTALSAARVLAHYNEGRRALLPVRVRSQAVARAGTR